MYDETRAELDQCKAFNNNFKTVESSYINELKAKDEVIRRLQTELSSQRVGELGFRI
jgi:hypothetical protein